MTILLLNEIVVKFLSGENEMDLLLINWREKDNTP